MLPESGEMSMGGDGLSSFEFICSGVKLTSVSDWNCALDSFGITLADDDIAETNLGRPACIRIEE